MNDEIYLQKSRTDKPRLHEHISIPSEIHSYSLAVLYMRDWFLRQFDEDYFKTVYVNGKHVFDDYRRFNKKQLLKIEKPAVSILPTIDYSYDRERVDLMLGGRSVLTRRSRIFDDSIIRDYENNYFLGMDMKQLQMNFTYRIRVSSRAQQIDLYNFMKFAFRVGSTQHEFVSYDFHIPYEIMLNIARHAGFEIIEDETKQKRKRVKDIVKFMQYLNSHSGLPILYKMRTINGNSEFFFRMPDMYTHVSVLDELSLDDGEREGQLDNNFHIEMNCTVKIPTPQYYYYYSSDKIAKKFESRKNLAGLYEISNINPPDRNESGWEQYLITEYMEEEKHIDTIVFKDLLTDAGLLSVLNSTIKMGLSPKLFMDIKFYNNRTERPVKIDWETCSIIVDSDLPAEISVIAIYIDLQYVNEQLTVNEELMENSLSK